MSDIKLIHGDCLDVMRDMPDKSVDLVVMDPPYNIKKANWDKWKTVEDYVCFMGKVFLLCERTLKENGSFYFFHNDFLQIVELQNWLNKNSNFVFKRFIVWNKRFDGAVNKGCLDGHVQVNGLRNYQQMVEYCLFYTFQDETGLNKIMASCVEPIIDYIRSEITKAKGKIIYKDINSFFGTATNGGGVASAVLSKNKTVPAMITEEHYLKLREYCGHGFLVKEYEELRKEYEELRNTFNNQKTHHSMWEYETTKKIGHITQKPIKLIENIVKHSSNEGNTILDPFMGSGTTGVACHNLNRNFIGCEIDAEYFAIAKKRIDDVQRQGRLF